MDEMEIDTGGDNGTTIVIRNGAGEIEQAFLLRSACRPIIF